MVKEKKRKGSNKVSILEGENPLPPGNTEGIEWTLDMKISNAMVAEHCNPPVA